MSFRTRCSSFVVLGTALVLGAAPVPAKEHAAGCVVLPTLVERFRSTLLLAAVQRSRGSALGAYQVLHTNATSFLGERTAQACGVVPRMFESAIARAAKAETAADAGAHLDLAFTAGLALVLGGQLPRDDAALKHLPVNESAQYGENCPDLFPLARRLSSGGGSPDERAAAVLTELRARPRCPRIKAFLERTPPDHLPDAIDAFVLDEAQGSPSAGNPLARCPELPLVLDRITAAIAVGVPLFNSGDHDGCRRVYDKTTRALVDEVIPQNRCPAVRTELRTALAEASGAGSATDAAWALRRGFDRITAAVSGPGDSSPPASPQ